MCVFLWTAQYTSCLYAMHLYNLRSARRMFLHHMLCCQQCVLLGVLSSGGGKTTLLKILAEALNSIIAGRMKHVEDTLAKYKATNKTDQLQFTSVRDGTSDFVLPGEWKRMKVFLTLPTGMSSPIKLECSMPVCLFPFCTLQSCL